MNRRPSAFKPNARMCQLARSSRSTCRRNLQDSITWLLFNTPQHFIHFKHPVSKQPHSPGGLIHLNTSQRSCFASQKVFFFTLLATFVRNCSLSKQSISYQLYTQTFLHTVFCKSKNVWFFESSSNVIMNISQTKLMQNCFHITKTL